MILTKQPFRFIQWIMFLLHNYFSFIENLINYIHHVFFIPTSTRSIVVVVAGVVVVDIAIVTSVVVTTTYGKQRI